MKKFLLSAFIGILCMLASCTSSRPLTYFSDIDQLEITPIGDYNVKIMPSDELIITVTSKVPYATAPYNLPLSNPAVSSELLRNSTARQQTFVVDSDGDINFPVLGKIHVEGLTLDQLRDKLTAEISKDVDEPIVKVALVNFYVNVAGEVSRPGRINVNNERFSVLDAITSAGDLTAYGERTNVLVIREENGVRTHARLDLTKAETLQSPYFFLKQNDYVYIEPNKIRREQAKYNQNNSYKLSLTSTIVSACSVIVSLIIALTR